MANSLSQIGKTLDYQIKLESDIGSRTGRIVATLCEALPYLSHHIDTLREVCESALAKPSFMGRKEPIKRALDRIVLNQHLVPLLGIVDTNALVHETIQDRIDPAFLVLEHRRSTQRVLQGLKEEGVTASQVGWCPHGFSIDDKPRGWSILDLRKKGVAFLKGAESMLPPELLPPPKDYQRVLDMCASPGGKTIGALLRLQETAGAECTTNDADEHRFNKLSSALFDVTAWDIGPRLRATKLDGRSFGDKQPNAFDGVLCDVPCSGLGKVGHERQLWMFPTDAFMAELITLQRELLTSAIRTAKPGGRVVYSTCTYDPRECEQQVAAALKEHAGSVRALDPRTLLPGINGRWSLQPAMEQSQKVQEGLGIEPRFPAVRFSPDLYSGKARGFFTAVLEKQS